MNEEKQREKVYRKITTNKKALFEYEVIDKIEAGIMLTGTEVKSLRIGKCNLQDSYCRFLNKQNDDLFILQMHINPYEHGNRANHEVRRNRKLLIHHHQAVKWRNAVNERGYTMVPIEIYFVGHLVKVEIALVKPKKKYEKRETIKKRDTDRELRRKMLR